MKSIVLKLNEKYSKLNQEDLFQTLLSIRKSMYKLIDHGVLEDHEITDFEEEILGRRGIDPQDFYNWKNN